MHENRGRITVEDAAARDDGAQPGEPTRSSSKDEVLGQAVALGPVFGAAFGMLLGLVLFDNTYMGIGIGAGLGLLIGVAIGSRRTGQQDRGRGADAEGMGHDGTDGDDADPDGGRGNEDDGEAPATNAWAGSPLAPRAGRQRQLTGARRSRPWW